MREIVRFFQDNLQILVGCSWCVSWLGFVTFLAVVFGIVSSQSMSTTAEPSGTIGLLELVLR